MATPTLPPLHLAGPLPRRPAAGRRGRLLATVALAAAVAAYLVLAGHALVVPPLGAAGLVDPGLHVGPGITAVHVRYEPAAGDPALVGAVVFDLEPAGAATAARVRLVAGGAWYPCTVQGGEARCPVERPEVAFGDLLELAVRTG